MAGKWIILQSSGACSPAPEIVAQILSGICKANHFMHRLCGNTNGYMDYIRLEIQIKCYSPDFGNYHDEYIGIHYYSQFTSLGKMNIIFAVMFCAIIFYNEFILSKKLKHPIP